MKPAVIALKYFDASISHMLIVTKLQVQKKNNYESILCCGFTWKEDKAVFGPRSKCDLMISRCWELLASLYCQPHLCQLMQFKLSKLSYSRFTLPELKEDGLSMTFTGFTGKWICHVYRNLMFSLLKKNNEEERYIWVVAVMFMLLICGGLSCGFFLNP